MLYKVKNYPGANFTDACHLYFRLICLNQILKYSTSSINVKKKKTLKTNPSSLPCSRILTKQFLSLLRISQRPINICPKILLGGERNQALWQRYRFFINGLYPISVLKRKPPSGQSAVPVNPVTQKGPDWLLGGFLFGTEYF